ncbi:DUF1843 domain-containing protein [Pseudotenacibaculum haliotis]|uniref:DUF1843 domain-containing protein n=1 Tax=Pseudotenacibaculum haliotis TaxID=1862138 RepID=A0ABW5LTV6_9FLAO
MGVVVLYAAGIREAVASNDIEKMKAVAAQAEATIRAHGDLHVAYLDLVKAIQGFEGKGKKGKGGKKK